MAGICRGGQFLNVMNGGSMWQHVNNHIGNHMAFEVLTQKEIIVTSTHHQMMVPTDEALVLMTASRATVRQGGGKAELLGERDDDVEAIYYPKTECLCFQPHPEYFQPNHPCQTTYFDYLNTFFGL